MALQQAWRYCTKCHGMFFDGYPDKGICPSGGGHAAAGYNFSLSHDIPESPTDQGAWRYCTKCHGMFFDGYPDKGICPSGGSHGAAGYTFVLRHDVPESPFNQSKWRYCGKCHGLFFDGYPDKGRCAGGGGHAAAGLTFVLGHDTEFVKAFDQRVTTDIAVGGSAHLVMQSNGSFTFSTHAHDSGFDNIRYTISAVLLTSAGIAFTFTHSGHTEGTSAHLPFGTPKRNDDFIIGGSDQRIIDEWPGIVDANFHASIAGTDTLANGVGGAVDDLLGKLLADAGEAAAAAVIALVA